jgi:hypothetical protein
VLGWGAPFGAARCVRAVVAVDLDASSREIVGQTWVRFERAEEAAAALAAAERRDAAEEPVPRVESEESVELPPSDIDLAPSALPAAVEVLPASRA